MFSLQGMSVVDLAENSDTTTADLFEKGCPVVKVCRTFGSLTLRSVQNVADLGNVEECSRGDTDERELTPTGLRGCGNTSRCMRYTKRRNIN